MLDLRRLGDTFGCLRLLDLLGGLGVLLRGLLGDLLHLGCGSACALALFDFRCGHVCAMRLGVDVAVRLHVAYPLFEKNADHVLESDFWQSMRQKNDNCRTNFYEA